MFETYKDVVTVKDIQNMLGVCKTTAYKLVTSGEIQSLRVGKKFLIPKMAVIAYLTNATSSAILDRHTDEPVKLKEVC